MIEEFLDMLAIRLASRILPKYGMLTCKMAQNGKVRYMRYAFRYSSDGTVPYIEILNKILAKYGSYPTILSCININKKEYIEITKGNGEERED